MPTSVTVVGAGIVGACLAYQLVRDGAEVTVVEREPTAGAGVTRQSFAWIGDGERGHWPGVAARLRPHILADHHRLAAEVPEIPYRWCGSLVWPPPDAGHPRNQPPPNSGHPRNQPPPDPGHPGSQTPPDPGHSRSQPPLDPGPRNVGRDAVAALEPGLREPPQRAVHSPTDGAVDATGMAAALVEAARRAGARVHLGSSFPTPGAAPADVVVRATGAALTETSPAVLIRASAPPGLVRTIVSAPGFEVREGRPGELLFAAEAGHDPEMIVARFRAAWARAERVRLLSWAVGTRPMPPQGPIIGYDRSGAYRATMHSAVCLAPTAARLAAREILSGHRPPELGPPFTSDSA
ncbi:NAD(P)/FAD-dependent oxidoreductase [Actinoplanes sp. NPDC049265]|uniref:NAD(P)/FAD-dependent oxidoreductase n=1 Tax=Actinoplanes sp. NPDC049265 TaxID=3363902 RepID=UPI0037105EED